MQVYKLGKKPVKKDMRTLLFAKYLTTALPINPPSYSWLEKVPNWLMLKNDEIGDCTVASAGHLIMEWTADCGTPFVPSDDQIVAAYSAITGYTPADPNSDNGAAEIDVLNWWKANGIAGHKIGAYASIQPANVEDVKSAIYLFGGCYLGVSLPLTAQGADSWDLVSITGDGLPGSYGGHAVPALAYDANGVTVITWGQTLKMSWDFFKEYVEESYAVFSPDFVNGTKPAPNGFDMETLQNDLNAL